MSPKNRLAPEEETAPAEGGKKPWMPRLVKGIKIGNKATKRTETQIKQNLRISSMSQIQSCALPFHSQKKKKKGSTTAVLLLKYFQVIYPV